MGLKWKSINVNSNLVIAQSERSVLIAMPHSSGWDGYRFWHPSKLVREGRNSAAIEISYNDAFSFRLKKCGKGKWNKRDAIDEREISAEEFEEAFGVVDGNISAKGWKNPYETHKPDKLEPVNAEALEELKEE